jgi:hypothetical protein
MKPRDIPTIILGMPPAKTAWYALRKAVPVTSSVPVRKEPTYRTAIWGDAKGKRLAIPRIIWSYWQGEASPSVTACRNSWLRNNPDWTIHVLSSQDLRSYLPDFPPLPRALPPQKISNLVRLMLMERHGGVWLDASTIATTSLDWIRSLVNARQCEVGLFWNERQGVYKRDAGSPIVENGCICASPGSAFIKHWRENYQRCITSDSYENYFPGRDDFQELSRNFESKSNISYFVCYLAAQQTMQSGKNYRLLLINSEDEFYYFYYNTRKPRNRRQFSDAILLSSEKYSDKSRLIKITQGHRSLIDDHIRHGCFRRDSLLGQYI